MNKVLSVGQEASALDIFLSSNGSAVSGKYVGFQLFDAANASAVSGVALNPALGHYVGSGVIPAGFQLGDWRVDWTIISLGNGLIEATEQFTVQDLVVMIGFIPETDDLFSVYNSVRIDIGDPDGIIFNDGYLQHVLIKAVRRLNHRLGLSNRVRSKGVPGGFGGPQVKVSPITADVESGAVEPDNDEIKDLIILQMEVIIAESEIASLKRLLGTGPAASTITNAGVEGVSVTNADGVVMSISPSRLSFRSDLHKFDAKQKRDELEASIKAFLARISGSWGKMIY